MPYVLAWVDRKGRTGRGALQWPKEKAEQMAREFNADQLPYVRWKAVEVTINSSVKTENVQSDYRNQNQHDDSKRTSGIRPSGVRNQGSNRAKNEQHPKEDL